MVQRPVIREMRRIGVSEEQETQFLKVERKSAECQKKLATLCTSSVGRLD